MEKNKKTHPIFARMVKLFKSRLFRGFAVLLLLAISFFTMLMMDKGNRVRREYFAFLENNFLQGFINEFNIAIRTWILYLCCLSVAFIFTVGNMIEPLIVNKLKNGNPLNVKSEKNNKSVYTLLYYLMLILVCGLAILIAWACGAFNKLSEIDSSVFINLLYTSLIAIGFMLAIALAICIVWLIVESIIHLCNKDKKDEIEETPLVEESLENVEPAVEEEPKEEIAITKETPIEDTVDNSIEESTTNEKPEIIAFSKDAFGNRAVKRSFSAKLCQSEDAVKEYYSEIKNHLLSYKKVNSRVSFNYDSFNFGRPNIAKLALKGKTLVLYLSLKYEDYAGSKYHPKDASKIKKYENTPMYVRVKSSRGVKFAKELIDIVLEGEPKKKDPVNISYVVPYKTDEQLISEGLIKIIEKK